MQLFEISGLIIAIILLIVGVLIGFVVAYLINLGKSKSAAALPAPTRATGGRILLPFTGEKAPGRALEVAMSMARARDAQLVLLYVAIVPVTLNIEAELTREVEKGFSALEVAEREARTMGIESEIRLERERTFRKGIIDMLEREPFDVIVVEMEAAGPSLKLERQIEIVSYLFQRVETEIVIVR